MQRLAAAIALSLVGACSTQPIEEFDLVVANGRVMDPESGLDAVRHVGIRGGRDRGDIRERRWRARASSTPPATSSRPGSSICTSTGSRKSPIG